MPSGEWSWPRTGSISPARDEHAQARRELEELRREFEQVRRELDREQVLEHLSRAGEHLADGPRSRVRSGRGRVGQKARLEASTILAEARSEAAKVRMSAQNDESAARVEAERQLRAARDEAERLLGEARDEAESVRAELAPLREWTLSQAQAIRDRMRISLLELDRILTTESDGERVVVLDSVEDLPPVP